jgi:hypothetical protein
MTNHEFWIEVNKVYTYYRHAQPLDPWRYGQTAFNVLHNHYPDQANAIRGTEADPFNIQDADLDYTNPRWCNFVAYIQGMLC